MYYQLYHNRVSRQINAKSRLYPSEWDNLAKKVVIPSDIEESRGRYLEELQGRLSENYSRLKAIITRLDHSGEDYAADDIISQYYAPPENYGLVSFSKKLIKQLREIGKVRTSETYTTTLNSFMRFRGHRGDIMFNDVDDYLMEEYETYLKHEGICPNSTSYYMRNLRAIYNRAVEQGLTMQRNPFRRVYTGIDKTVKRAVPLAVIRQIRDMDLSDDPLLDYARDIFMFSFYTRGMSFVDMAYLKKSDLQNGILSYRRQKTNQRLFVRWEKPMQDIIAKYDTRGTPYLLPIIRDNGKDERTQYASSAHQVNKKLKLIGRKLELSIPLTTYVARHGWASIAKSKNIPLSIISEAMGHDSEKTTRIYLASLDTSTVDKANSLILKSL